MTPTSRETSGGEPAAASSGLEALHPGTLDCVHCGLCLSSCPTYRVTGRETSSPRGRVYLMRGVAEGKLPLAALVEEAWLCLGCRACETACPSGVEYGALVEQARAAVASAGLRRGLGPALERAALRGVVPRRRRLSALVSLLAWVQRLRLDRLALPLLGGRLREMHGLLPHVPPAAERRRLVGVHPARGPRRGRVAFFEGCIMPELFGASSRATLSVLTRAGFEVVVPAEQGCCGALQAHAGDAAFASRLARTNVAAFAGGGFDAVVTHSAGCGAALREYDRWLGEPGAALAAQARDVCAFLDDVGLEAPLHPVPLRVCYDDPCHLLHGQGVATAPRRLLARIPGLELVPHEDPGSCCGAAGIYNLTHPDMSREVRDRKLAALAAAAPDAVATGNPGCLMQLRAGAAAAGLSLEVVHPIELLDRALTPTPPHSRAG